MVGLTVCAQPPAALRCLVYTPIEADTLCYAAALGAAFPQQIQVDAAWQPEEAARLAPTAEVLMAWSFPRHLYPTARCLRWLQKLGTGVDDLDASLLPAGVVVSNMPQVFGPWVAEHCLAYLLACAKRVRLGLELQAQRDWAAYEPALLRGRIVGVAGLGHIGSEVARLAGALGMTVYGLRRRPDQGQAVPAVARLFGPSERLEFLRDLDYLVLALPATAQTTGFMDQTAFAALKRGVTVINVGRGNAIVEPELIAAVQRGQVHHAVLDVTTDEPLPPQSPLWTLPGVWITPHVAGPVRVEGIPAVMVAQMGRYLRGEPPDNVVDLSRGY